MQTGRDRRGFCLNWLVHHDDNSDATYQPGDSDLDSESSTGSKAAGDPSCSLSYPVEVSRHLTTNTYDPLANSSQGMDESAQLHDKRTRCKKKCPVRKCRAVVTALPRHLRQRHGWSRAKSTAAVQTFNLRKPIVCSDGVPAQRYVTCQLNECVKFTVRSLTCFIISLDVARPSRKLNVPVHIMVI